METFLYIYYAKVLFQTYIICMMHQHVYMYKK